jgi:hypothetical protein
MPYQASNVPENVPKDYRKEWAEVWNNAYESQKKKGKSNEEAESYAFAVANSRYGPNGQYVKNFENPKTSDSLDVSPDPSRPEKVMHEISETAPLLFLQFTKVSAKADGTCEVAGVATAEKGDKDGETLDYGKSKPHFQAWSDEARKATTDEANPDRLSLGNVREMHDPKKAVGKLTALNFNDDQKQIEAVAHIVDRDSAEKCRLGVLKGFSIGGKYVGGKPMKGMGQKYVASPSEISVVDNPCLPDAHFTYVKEDGSTEIRKFADTADPPKESVAEEIKKVLFSDETIKKFSDAVFANLKKDHEEFQVTQGGPGEPRLALPAGQGMVDTKPQQHDVAPRTAGPFEEDPEEYIQDLNIGVSKDDCPCEHCKAERDAKCETSQKVLETYGQEAADALAEIQKKAEQNYATHGGTKVPKGKHAYAPAGSNPSDWKYPVDTKARAQNALSRWGQHKGIPAAEEPKVARRIIAAARRFGITVDPDSKISQDAKKGENVSPEFLESQKTSDTLKVVEKVAEETVMDDLEKGKGRRLAEAEAAMKAVHKAHQDYHKAFSEGADKVLKAVAHGDEPFNRPDNVNPQQEIQSVGADPTETGKKPEQLPAVGTQQTWKTEFDAFRAEVNQKISDGFKSVAESVASSIGKTVAEEIQKALKPAEPEKKSAVGDRSNTVDNRKKVSDGQADQLRKDAPVDVDALTKNPTAAKAALESKSTILNIMRGNAEQKEVPNVVMKAMASRL